MAEQETKAGSLKTFKYLPLSIHLETQGGLASSLILRGTPLPAHRSQTFSTVVDNQESIQGKILIGESPLAEKNIVVSTLTLSGIPKAAAGKAEIKISYSIDEACRVRITAAIDNTEFKVDPEFLDISKYLKPVKIDKIIQEAETDRAADEEVVKLIEAKNKASSTISKAEAWLKKNLEKGAARNPDRDVQKAIAALGLALQSGNAEKIRSDTYILEKSLIPLEPFEYGSVFDQFFASIDKKKRSSTVISQEKKSPIKPLKKEAEIDTPKDDELSSPKKSTANYGKIFGGGEFTLDPNLCFVLMPFNEKLRPIFEDNICPVVQAEGLSCLRADEIHHPNLITWDIWEKINRARFLVADLTGQNANVFYELGLAHALGKDVLLLTQSMDDVPFDLRAIRCIVYDFTPRGVKELERKLKASISAIMKSA